MDDLMEQIEAALEKGRAARATEPHAVFAEFNAESDRIVVMLANGASFEFPPHLAQGLEGASREQLSEVEVVGDGSALHWEALDADFSVPSLLNGIFGTAKWMAAQAGSKKSARKAAAARKNGSKGGRPSRVELRSRSEAMSAIVGNAPLPRAEMISRVWDHIRKNNLQNPNNKREILADDKLKAVFGKERLSMYELGKKLALIREEEAKAEKSESSKVGRRTSSKLSRPISSKKWGASKKSA